MITDREEVKAYYNVFILEDKNGKLTLDHLKAADHVHTVLKRTEEAQCNLSRYLIVSNPNPSPRGSGYPNFNIRNITIPTVGTHSCMFTSTKVAFFTRLLFPFLLLLQQEDDLPIQPRDCSSKSPAPLHHSGNKSHGNLVGTMN